MKVEQLRSLVFAHLLLPPRDGNNMDEKQRFLKKVWPRVEEFFDQYGPANYTGYLAGDEQGWLGPYIWSENGDTVRVITRFCEDEFGFLNVHNESKIDKFQYENFDSGVEKTKSIDIDVTDASECNDYREFRRLKHALFIEVKQISKGCIFNDHKDKIQGFVDDCTKLQHQIDSGRCKYAITVLIDDGGLKGKPYVADADHLIETIKAEYPDVEPLIWQKKCGKSQAFA